MPQGSDEWHQLRLGKFSASKAYQLFMAPSTKGYSDLINQIVYERITGKGTDDFVSPDMMRGIEMEPEAREAYQLRTFNLVKEVGFVELTEFVGCSPDGLIGKDGLLEIKCLKWNTHIQLLFDGKYDKRYDYQMQFQMYVTDRSWCDFFCYHPELSPFLKRVNRNDKVIDEIKINLNVAIGEVVKRIKKISPLSAIY